MASSRPGVSYSSSKASPSTDNRAPSTCRVVLGRWETSPKPTSRVNVRSSEVLPTLVWPTTASFSGLVMTGLQPVQRRAVGEGQLQLLQRCVPIAQALGVQCLAGRSLQQPHTGGGGAACQLGDQRQAATVGRAPWVASDGQARGRETGELFQQFVARFAAVEDAGVFHAGRQFGRPGVLIVEFDGDQQRAVALQFTDASCDVVQLFGRGVVDAQSFTAGHQAFAQLAVAGQVEVQAQGGAPAFPAPQAE